MTEPCCDVLGGKLDEGKSWYTAKKRDGSTWVPTFIEYVDPEKCTGCGMCVKVCSSNVYEMKELDDGRKVSQVVNPESCLGDCHCHKVCPVSGGAMVCKPRLLEEIEGGDSI